MPTYVHLRTVSLEIPGRPATHNPLVVGSSPTGPTILKAAHCAAFVFPGFGVLLFKAPRKPVCAHKTSTGQLYSPFVGLPCNPR